VVDSDVVWLEYTQDIASYDYIDLSYKNKCIASFRKKNITLASFSIIHISKDESKHIQDNGKIQFDSLVGDNNGNNFSDGGSSRGCSKSGSNT